MSKSKGVGDSEEVQGSEEEGSDGERAAGCLSRQQQHHEPGYYFTAQHSPFCTLQTFCRKNTGVSLRRLTVDQATC